jgi:hypothetical protein
MKISELIKELIEVLIEEGDIDAVLTADDMGLYHADLYGVTVVLSKRVGEETCERVLHIGD